MNSNILAHYLENLDDEDKITELFASLKPAVAALQLPRRTSDHIIAMAHQAVQRVLVSQPQPEPVHRWQQDRFLAMAAADGVEKTTGDVYTSESGDWSLHTTFNRRDPSQKTVYLYFQGDKAKDYEGCEVKLRKGEVMILSGTVENGQIKAKIPAGVTIKPPLNISFDVKTA